MQVALELFRHNLQRSRDLTDVFRALNAQTTGALDLSDILRAGLVMSVAAMDHFIHEIVRIGILDTYRAERPQTQAFLQFRVTIKGVLQAFSGFDSAAWLESEIRERHGYQSFQMPTHISDAVRLVSDVALWDEVACHLGIERRDVTDRLTLIVHRRNKIAHEADIMADYAGQIVYSDLRSPIDEHIVDEAVNFIESIAESIYFLVSPKQPATLTN